MKCPICEQVIRKKPVVFQMIYFSRLQEKKAVCKKCYDSFSEQDIYNKLAPLKEGMSLEEAMEFRRKRIKRIRPEMKCPICNDDFNGDITKQGIVFREKDFPDLVKDTWICNKCYTTYKEDAIIEKIRHVKCPICKDDYYDKLQGIVFRDTWICNKCYSVYKENIIIEKIRQPDPAKVFDEPVHKKSGMKEFFGWFFWGSATALAFGITFIGLTNLDDFVGLIFLVFGGGFLSACLVKLVKRIRMK